GERTGDAIGLGRLAARLDPEGEVGHRVEDSRLLEFPGKLEIGLADGHLEEARDAAREAYVLGATPQVAVRPEGFDACAVRAGIAEPAAKDAGLAFGDLDRDRDRAVRVEAVCRHHPEAVEDAEFTQSRLGAPGYLGRVLFR